MIDVASGSVVSSISLGADKGNLTSNIVLTAGHLFVSNEREVFAVDLQQANTPVVWTGARGGYNLAITPDNLLIVSNAANVVAYKLH